MSDERDERGGRDSTDSADPSASAPIRALPGDGTDEIRLAAPIDDIPRGTLIGQYVILGRIGQGGMGIVYGAFDPDLDRKIALKLIPVTEDDPERARELRLRLIKAAQSAMRVSHRAVIDVFDVDAFEGGIYIAMEFVDGLDLRRWMEARDEPFPWREVLRVFREAGRGLAAAHAAGVVHGDFKPDNVLLGKGGRICVVDFGLTEVLGEVEEPDIRLPELKEAIGDIFATHEDNAPEDAEGEAFPGTPAYMAPEQHVGAGADPKTDQFGFCVAFYEALYGERPFVGERRGAIAMEAIHHRVREAPSGSNVPAWLREVLLRGLSPRRADRFSSMDALVQALDRDPIARRKRWTKGLVAVGVLTGLAGGMAYIQWLETNRCKTTEESLIGVWDPSRRDMLAAAFADSGHPQAETIWKAVETSLDDWAQEWLDYRERACRITRVRGDATEELMLRRYACLDGRLHAFEAFGNIYGAADRAMVDRAYDVAHDLMLPSACISEHVLELTPPLPEEGGEAVETLRKDLAEARVAFEAGQSEQARARVQRVLTDLEGIDDPPTEVGAHLLLGRTEAALGRTDIAERELHDAGIQAQELALLYEQARSWNELTRLLTVRDRFAEAGAWSHYAEASARRLKDEAMLGEVFLVRGELARADGRPGDALALFHQALERLERAYGRRDDARLAGVLIRLGTLVAERGDPAAAARYLERGIELRQAHGDRTHPDAVMALLALAEIREAGGDLDGAIEGLERAVGVLNTVTPPDIGRIGRAKLALARLRLRRGDTSTALAAFEDAAEAFESLGDRAGLAAALDGAGRVLLQQEQVEDARPRLEEALALRQQQATPRLDLAATQEALAQALWYDAAERRQALELARSARAAYAAAGPESIEAIARVDAWLSDHETP